MSLFETVSDFLGEKSSVLKDNIHDAKADIAYSTDLFTKFNETNLQLQGDSLNLIKTNSTVSSFIARREELDDANSHCFPTWHKPAAPMTISKSIRNI